MPAAGIGRRFGGERPKQYQALAGATVIEHALAPFLADGRCRGAVVALDAADRFFDELAVASDPRVHRAPGGAQRCDSVRNGLAALPATDQDWVLVHDAARPCLQRPDLDCLLETLADDDVGGLLATPLADTLKRADASLRVSETPGRTGLWRALTPQMFRFGVLRRALEQAAARGLESTDEAQAVEWLGLAPRLVQGSAANVKITTADDLILASNWFRQEKRP